MGAQEVDRFGAGKFIRLHYELLESDAFVGLGAAAQRILVDFIGEWNRADATGQLVNGGIRYSYGMCRVDVAKSTFKLAMLELVKHGFVGRARPSERRPGAPHFYRAQDKWKRFSADQLAGVVDFEEAVARVRAVQARRGLYAAQAQLELALDAFGVEDQDARKVG